MNAWIQLLIGMTFLIPEEMIVTMSWAASYASRDDFINHEFITRMISSGST